MKQIKVDEQLDREMRRKARRKAQVEHGSQEQNQTKVFKNKKKFNRKEKQRTKYYYQEE